MSSCYNTMGSVQRVRSLVARQGALLHGSKLKLRDGDYTQSQCDHRGHSACDPGIHLYCISPTEMPVYVNHTCAKHVLCSPRPRRVDANSALLQRLPLQRARENNCIVCFHILSSAASTCTSPRVCTPCPARLSQVDGGLCRGVHLLRCMLSK